MAEQSSSDTLSLVERLTKDAAWLATSRMSSDEVISKLLSEAASRIEQVEAENARLREAQDFYLGQPVEIAPSYKYAEDWRGQPLWIAGVTAYTGAVLYDVSEHWPPTHLGDITSDFRPEDLIARQALSLTAGGEEDRASRDHARSTDAAMRPSACTGQGSEG